MARGDSLEVVVYQDPSKPKLCTECNWYKKDSRNVGVPSHPVIMEEHNCHNPYVTREHTDVIFGITHDRISCNLARYGAIGVHGACGIKGQFWEKK